jgi:amino acid permease
MNTVNIVVFAYNNQFNVPQLTGELTPQPSIRRMTVVSYISTALSFSLYALVSLFGVLAFGVASNQKDTLVLDLFPARKYFLVEMTLVAVMFSVLTCFQFHIYPIRQFLAYTFRKGRGRGANDEASDAVYYGKSVTRWIDMACAFISVVCAVIIATAITELKTILDFIGAFASAWVSYVIPPLFIIAIRRKQEGFSWMNGEIILCSAFFMLGIFLFVFGTYSAIVG